MKENEEIKCSFCGRKKSDVDLMIGGLTGHICNNCVEQAIKIIREESDDQLSQTLSKDIDLLRPSEIKKHLDKYIIDQDQAKKVLAVAVYNHFKRITQPADDDDVEIEKSNIVLVGRTGTGKTLLAKTIAKILNVPFCIADATVLTEAGYVGEDVEAILSRLYQAADGDVKAAERGIVFIDEIDKTARKGDNASITRDVSGEGVQQALLKLLEGNVVGIPPQGGRKHPEQKLVQIDTKNILFVCGGAFDGIERIIEKRRNSQTIGYGKKPTSREEKENLLRYVTPADLKSYGLIPELIGRFPVLSHLNPLERDALKRILTEPTNSLIKQYEKLFDLENIELVFKESALDIIVDKAMEFKLGARGLRSICEAVMLDAMYEIPSTRKPGGKREKLVVDEEYVQKHLNQSALEKLKAA